MTSKLTREEIQEIISVLGLLPSANVHGVSFNQLVGALSEYGASLEGIEILTSIRPPHGVEFQLDTDESPLATAIQMAYCTLQMPHQLFAATPVSMRSQL